MYYHLKIIKDFPKAFIKKTHPNRRNYKLSTHKNRNTHFFLHIAASLENKAKDKLCGDTDKKDIKQYIWFIMSGYKSDTRKHTSNTHLRKVLSYGLFQSEIDHYIWKRTAQSQLFVMMMNLVFILHTFLILVII